MKKINLLQNTYIAAKTVMLIVIVAAIVIVSDFNHNQAVAAETATHMDQLVQSFGPLKSVDGKLPSTTPGDIDQWMPNKRLQESILMQLNIQAKANNIPLKWHDVSEISQLDLQFLQIINVDGSPQGGNVSTYIDGQQSFSIVGLQYAQNATFLSLSGGDYNYAPFTLFGDLVDISPLRLMPGLKTVYLDYNRIEDVSPLAGLQKLTFLSLVNNHIHDFSSLQPIQAAVKDYRYQHVTLPRIAIDPVDRWAHLENNFRLPNGELAHLIVRPRMTIDDFYDLPGVGNERVRSRIYMNINNDTIYQDDAETGLEYWEIPDQEAGITTLPGWHITPQPDRNFLLAEGQSEDESEIFDIVQPYRIDSMTAGKITVHYRDEQDRTIAPDKELPAGEIGSPYTTQPIKRAGYTLLTAPANATGKYTETAITITYKYHKQAPAVTAPKPPTPTQSVKPTLPGTVHTLKATVTVHYLDQAGVKLHADRILRGQIGESYTTDAISIQGYMLYDVPRNSKGVFTKYPEDVTYVYQTTIASNDVIGASINGTVGDGVTADKRPVQMIGQQASKAEAKPVKQRTRSGDRKRTITSQGSRHIARSVPPTIKSAGPAPATYPGQSDDTVQASRSPHNKRQRVAQRPNLDWAWLIIFVGVSMMTLWLFGWHRSRRREREDQQN
ncbi:MucBP domain-containing protein [Levilactobacillus sp. N40-8-2]|uniref:MucBP domain-containing protein n=1 Tax=Levilactobacillus muriae TaxID=3238987 RepID=UPI0038B34DAF